MIFHIITIVETFTISLVKKMHLINFPRLMDFTIFAIKKVDFEI